MFSAISNIYNVEKLQLLFKNWFNQKGQKLEELTQQNTDLKLRLAKADQELATQKTENVTLNIKLEQLEKELNLQKLENRNLLKQLPPAKAPEITKHHSRHHGDYEAQKQVVAYANENLLKPMTPDRCLDPEQRIKQVRLNQQIYA